MRHLYWCAGALFASLALSALAQTFDGQDIEAIRRRSAQMRSDAEALAEHVKDRGEAFRREAGEVQQGGIANLRRAAGDSRPIANGAAIDFDEIVQGAARNAALPSGDAPQLIVFASLSMPQASLKKLIADTAQAGGVVVFRGFPKSSAKAFVSGIEKVVAKEDMPQIGIDPRLFRAFGVETVPTFVAVASDFDLCAGFDCQTKIPPHDRMSGNVTVSYALSSFVDGNGPGARVAAIALGNLEGRSRP